MCFHKIIYKERTGVTFRLMFLDMPVKVVGMERAKQATACLGCQSPYILIVGVAVGPCPAHIHQRIFGESGKIISCFLERTMIYCYYPDLRSLSTVSYTHLDVYKRQDIYRLEDNEIVALKADSITVYNMEKEVVSKTPFHVD